MNYPHPMDDKTGFELQTCAVCCGEGVNERPMPQRDDPNYAIYEPCFECNGSGYVDDAVGDRDGRATITERA